MKILCKGVVSSRKQKINNNNKEKNELEFIRIDKQIIYENVQVMKQDDFRRLGEHFLSPSSLYRCIIENYVDINRSAGKRAFYFHFPAQETLRTSRLICHVFIPI